MPDLTDVLYREIEPYHKEMLKVSDLHTLYVEQSGDAQGKPILFLHGGPGGGSSPQHRRFFDPNHYRIVVFDQRGSGQSTPHAELTANTTWDLVEDIEKIRVHLNIDSWHVFGGSWGSTLALAYAETHPEVVTGLILRGIFLCRPEEIRWFYQEGAHWIFPDAWQSFVEPVAPHLRQDMVRAYYALLTHPDEKIRLQAARSWSRWEGSTVKLIPDPHIIAIFSHDHLALSIARIECHYFINNSFFKKPDQLLADIARVRQIPGVLVHGRYDIVCPVKNAFDLHSKWPESRLEIVPDAGHAADERGIARALRSATDGFRKIC